MRMKGRRPVSPGEQAPTGGAIGSIAPMIGSIALPAGLPARGVW
jgi:hypothetical protein